MSRLVLVSNRSGIAAGAGGLAVALGESVRDRQGLWLGWSGKLCDDRTPQVRKRSWRRFALVQTDLNRQDYELFYLGYANRCLWPVLHFRADLMDYQTRFHDGYKRVNQRFAETLEPLLEDDDILWVHDFHLLLLASELRKRGLRQRIGLFLHTPFPPGDIFAALPCHGVLAKGLADFDLIGFQTPQDQRRFADYMIAEHGANGDSEALTVFNRHLELGTFPVGIDARQFQKSSFSATGEREFKRVRDSLRGRQQIVGVDRLDYSKGLRRRMEAFELLLKTHEEVRGQVEFLQVAPLSRSELKAYGDFRRELEQATLSINTRYSQVDWTPVRYLNSTLPRQCLAGVYRASRIGLVTPMRDGMNLVAKEYVAAQDADDPGVLVLSKFAGAAQTMTSALLINPYDAGEIADAIRQAMNMGLAERKQRHAALWNSLLSLTPRDWAAGFIKRLGQVQRLLPAKAA